MRRRIITVLALCLTEVSAIQAKVTLHPLFTDNMVMQQQTTLKLQGTATPNKKVTITTGWDKKKTTTMADAQGKWSAQVTTPAAGGPWDITLDDGKKTALHNVMVGEVWFCSGQSNMEMPVAGWGKIKDYEQEIAQAQYPDIRLFQVKKNTAPTPLDDMQSNNDGWQPCSPTSVPEFSALAYLYARQLHKELGVPVGVIDCTWGGTPAEAWTSSETLEHVMGFEEHTAHRKELGNDANRILADYQQQIDAWNAQLTAKDKGFKNGKAQWADPATTTDSWPTMQLPGYWESSALPGFDGIVWFRHDIEVPAASAGKDLQLYPGTIDDEDVVYWNGEQVATGSGFNIPRHYTIPARLVKAGKNTLAIKVKDNGGEGGIAGNAEDLKAVTANGKTISLAGTWHYNVGCSLAEMPKAPANPHSSSYPSSLFNAMVHPCLQYPIKGVIWYQGCANVGFATQYEVLFKALIYDWRKQFGKPDMPFYFVQLANFLDRKDVQADSPWAALREAQDKALDIAGTGMVCNIDLGEANDIHPKNKQEVARRLANISLACTYGRSVKAYAPAYKDWTIAGKKAIISFNTPRHGEPFLTEDNLKGFIIAGPDHIFHAAQARATADGKVEVWSDKVDMPTAVRYGWADNPECSLKTQSGLRVPPFRTDSWNVE